MSSTKGANNLARFLNNANYSANAIHGKKSQLTRLVNLLFYKGYY